MTTENNTVNTTKTKAQPKRHREEFDGVTLEYVEKAAKIADLFNLNDLVVSIPTLGQKVKVRKYFVAGTDMEFEHPLVPKVKTHTFDVFELAFLLPYFMSGHGFTPYLYGLQGTGKTSTINQIHARLGLPQVSVILGEDSEVIDLGGQMLPTEAGGMRFAYGLLVQAMQNGWTIIFDEYDLLPIRQQKMLNEVMENGRFTIEVTGEQIEAHPNWRVCVIGNTNNTGGGHSMFAGKSSGDASVNERFQFIKKQHLTDEEEKDLLMNQLKTALRKHPRIRSITDTAKQKQEFDRYVMSMDVMIDNMLVISKRIRTAHEQSYSINPNGEVLNCTMSSRVLKKWLENVLTLSVFFDRAKDGKIVSSLFKRAYEVSFVNSISLDEQETVMNIFESSIAA